MVFSPDETRVNESEWERGQAVQASKYIKRLSGINYRTRTFRIASGRTSARGRDTGRDGYRPFLLHATNYLIGRIWPWPQILPALLSHSTIWTLMLKQYWYLIRAKPQNRMDRSLIWVRLPEAIYLPTKIEKQDSLSRELDLFLYTHLHMQSIVLNGRKIHNKKYVFLAYINKSIWW